jgi:endoglucanase
MTPNDDEVLARLRAALQAVADRTPISAGRLEDVWAAPAQKHSRPMVTIVSAAAAVAAIAAVTAVVVGDHTAGSRSVLPASAGESGVTASPVAQSPTPTITMTPSPIPSPTPTLTATPSPLLAADSCVPENYYVTASPSEVAGLTYLLPATPAGYVLYGAWGTISRNQCANSVTWYVEYDPASGTPGSGTDAIQLMVTKMGGDSVAGGFASATPVAATPITVDGNEGYVFNKDSAYAMIGWTTGGAAITLSGPVSNGDVASLVQVADSLVLVAPDDPRIVAPGDCQVPPGSTCPSLTATPSPSPSPTVTATPRSTPTSYPTATPSPSH